MKQFYRHVIALQGFLYPYITLRVVFPSLNHACASGSLMCLSDWCFRMPAIIGFSTGDGPEQSSSLGDCVACVDCDSAVLSCAAEPER